VGSLAGELGEVRGDELKVGTSGAKGCSVNGERGGARRFVAIRSVEESSASNIADIVIA
jgi:hypothetical protein